PARFWSKEAIAAAVLDRPLLLIAVLATSALTALYAGRLFALVFIAPPASEQARHAHESPWLMLAPLFVLAAGALVFGSLVAAGVLSVGAARSLDAPLALSLTSALLAIAGAALGIALYRRGPRAIVSAALSDAA